MKFGAHVSIAGGVFHAPQNGVEATCDVVQIFTRNQMQWRVPPLSQQDIEKFKAEEQRTGVEVVCVHASYLINLGGFDHQKLDQSRRSFVVEMERAEALGIPYLVVHPGSHVGRGEDAGIQRIAESLNLALEKCPDFALKILLETTAGQGDTLGYRFEQLGAILAKIDAPERVGVCLDTCHLFAAGYELRSREGYEETMAQLQAAVGVEKVGIIHANDSKREKGSRVDRHTHIGEGELGLEAFGFFVNDPRFREVPMIIETPGGAGKDAENLGKLRSLVKSKS
ncbi:MAG: deoxyribonuclease IV [Calditrichaeota bacterium]|nr:MAG: deoxyribonuclease IV [Calditrichota bacterium]